MCVPRDVCARRQRLVENTIQLASAMTSFFLGGFRCLLMARSGLLFFMKGFRVLQTTDSRLSSYRVVVTKNPAGCLILGCLGIARTVRISF